MSGSIDSDHNINVASDFIAQYTTRQKYRYSDTFSANSPGFDPPVDNSMRSPITPLFSPLANMVALDYRCMRLSEPTQKDLEQMLFRLYERINGGDKVSISEIRDALRRGAAVLCSSSRHVYPSIIHYLVALPFRVFSKESIRLGVSLWLGVMHENPRTEPRILVEVMEWWERTVEHKKGLFDPSFE